MTQLLPFRIGTGYDVHRFAAGRPLVLGGVRIEHARGLDGHSDADVLTHALADALLGALGLPDIGHYFPNNDPKIAGINSQEILAKALSEAECRGYTLANADIALIAEEPKIGPHLPAMKAALARTLKTEPSRLGIKATTHEKLGAFGRAEGMAAHAVVLLQRKDG
ncbi:MAG: 2-C-methyl-D-erythritol 2,4-cyclodiphosphate synthase [Opitutales bacterium]